MSMVATPKGGMPAWTPPPPDVWNPYVEGYGELSLFRHGTAFERRYAPRMPLQSARLSPDATLLVTASSDKTVRLHSVETGKQVQIFKHPDLVRSARFSHDGTKIVTACDDCFARIYSLETGEKVIDAQHRSRVTAACFSTDGQLLCTGSKDKTARVFFVGEPKDEQADGDGDGVVKSPSVKSSRPPSPVRAKPVIEDPYGDDPDFQPGGRWGRLGEWKRAQLGIPKNNEPVEEIPVQDIPMNPDDPPVIFTLDSSVLSATFDREGKRVCTGSGATRFSGAATIFDLETQEELYRFESHEDAVTSVELSHDGKLLFTASRDKTARIFSLDDKREIASFPHPNWVSSADPSHDRRWICTACDDGYARVWDVRFRKELMKLRHDGPVASAVFGAGHKPASSASERPLSRMEQLNAKPPPLPICTASHDGAARLFGVQKAN